jgi:hypothetical protein
LLIHHPASSAKPSKEWLFQLFKELVEECERSTEWNPDWLKGELLTDEYPLSDVEMTWRRILREAVQMHHGGAFVVVPDVASSPIDIRFRLKPHDLGREFVSAWLAVSQALSKDSPHDPLRPIENQRLADSR